MLLEGGNSCGIYGLNEHTMPVYIQENSHMLLEHPLLPLCHLGDQSRSLAPTQYYPGLQSPQQQFQHQNDLGCCVGPSLIWGGQRS